MVGSKSRVATHIKRDWVTCPFDTLGHALPLTVGETIKTIKIMRGTLDAAFELNKLIKYSMV